jgi:sugar-phosphatase
VTESKPHPEGFLKAASLLGIDPFDCVVFEDSPAGIQAGLAAGMIVIGVGRLAAANDPTYAVDDLTEIAIIEKPDGFELTIG